MVKTICQFGIIHNNNKENMKKQLLSFLISISTFASLLSQEVAVRSVEGEIFIIDVDPAQSFIEIMELLQHGLQEEEFVIDFEYSLDEEQIAKGKAPERHYERGLTDVERKYISFIVNTLGTASISKITKA